MNLSKHFTLAELTFSATAAAEHISNEPDAAAVASLGALCAAVLEPLREALGGPISISSGFRGPVLNKRVGGVADSQHLFGMAVDIQSAGMSVLALFQRVIAMGLPFDQIIYEARDRNTKWVHVSHRPGNNRGDIRVAQFAANGKPTGYPAMTAAQALAMVETTARSARVDGLVNSPEAAGEAVDVPYSASASASAPAPRAAPKAVVKTLPTQATEAPTLAGKKTAVHKVPAKKATQKSGAARVVSQAAPARKALAKKAVKKKSRA